MYSLSPTDFLMYIMRIIIKLLIFADNLLVTRATENSSCYNCVSNILHLAPLPIKHRTLVTNATMRIVPMMQFMGRRMALLSRWHYSFTLPLLAAAEIEFRPWRFKSSMTGGMRLTPRCPARWPCFVLICSSICRCVVLPPIGAAKQQPTPTAQAADSISVFLSSFWQTRIRGTPNRTFRNNAQPLWRTQTHTHTRVYIAYTCKDQR